MKEFDRLSQIHDGEVGGASRSGGGGGDNSGNRKTYILEHVLAAGISALRYVNLACTSTKVQILTRLLDKKDICVRICSRCSSPTPR
jgi:hypothetical protein